MRPKRVRFEQEEEDEEEGSRRGSSSASGDYRKRGRDDDEEEEEEEDYQPKKRHQNEDEDEDDDSAARGSWRGGAAAEQTYAHEDIERLEGDRMERFNMDEERELGTFDASGTFSWRRKDLLSKSKGANDDEDGEEEDGDEAWLAQVDEGKSSSSARPPPPPPVPVAPAVAPQQRDVMQSLWDVVRLLTGGEEDFALQALRRLGGAAASNNKEQFNRLTEACDLVMNCGLADVYALPRRVLVGKFPPILWEYRVVAEEGDGEIFGPFPGSDMQTWRDEHGFFQHDSNEQCECRSVCARTRQKSAWMPAHQIDTFFLSLV